MDEIKMMTKKEYLKWSTIRKKGSLDTETQKFIAEVHAKYFNHQYYTPCTCSGKTWNQWVQQLNDIWDLGYRADS